MEERGVFISSICFPCILLQPDVTMWKLTQRTRNDRDTPQSTVVSLVFSSADRPKLPHTALWDCCLSREDAAYVDHHPAPSSAHNCLHQLGKMVELFRLELLGLPQTPGCDVRQPAMGFFSHRLLPWWTLREGWLCWGHLHLVVINLVSRFRPYCEPWPPLQFSSACFHKPHTFVCVFDLSNCYMPTFSGGALTSEVKHHQMK